MVGNQLVSSGSRVVACRFAHPGCYTTSGREKKEETSHDSFALSIAVLAAFIKAVSDETWRSVMILRS